MIYNIDFLLFIIIIIIILLLLLYYIFDYNVYRGAVDKTLVITSNNINENFSKALNSINQNKKDIIKLHKYIETVDKKYTRIINDMKKTQQNKIIT